jgi:protein involved in polysaccharide export with SLBB domain
MRNGGDDRRVIDAGMRGFRRIVTCGLVVLGLGAVALAQVSGVSPDLMQQLQQQRNSGVTSATPGVTQREVILEPTAMSAPQPQSEVERILSIRAGMRLQMYGYDQMGVGRAVSLTQAGAVQDDYVLGVGDEVVLTLRGQENNEYRAQVDRDGNVTFPRLNPVSASGRTLGKFRQDLLGAIHRAYVSTEGFVSVGHIRQISVLVSGEVGSPGVRTLTGLSTVMDAVFVSGGIKKSGSLRNVRILRDGRTIVVDLYGILTNNVQSKNVVLTNGDKIIVPPLGGTIAVAGQVRRPAIYELPAGRSGISVREAMLLASGKTLPGVYTVSLLRTRPDGTRQLVDVSNEAGGVVRDGEIMMVKSAVNISTNQVRLLGAVRTPGTVALGKFKTLHDVLPTSNVLSPNAYMLMGIIDRVDPVTLQRKVIPFSPLQVIRGKTDEKLASNDTIRLFTKDDVLRIVSMSPAGRQLFAGGLEVNERPNRLSQSRAGASSNLAAATDEARLSSDSDNISSIRDTTQQSQFNPLPSAADIARSGSRYGNPNYGNPNYPNQNYGNPNYPNQNYGNPDYPNQNYGNPDYPNQNYGNPNYSNQNYGNPSYPNQNYGNPNNSTQNYGNPNYPNQNYASPNGVRPGDGLQSQQMFGRDAGQQDMAGLSLWDRYPGLANGAGSVALPDNMEEVSDLKSLLTAEDAAFYVKFLGDDWVTVNGPVKFPGTYLVAPNTPLSDVLACLGGFTADADRGEFEITSIAIDNVNGSATTTRAKHSASDDELARLVIQRFDRVEFHRIDSGKLSGSVTLGGEVRFPGVYSILRNEKLSSILERAGGLTDAAFPEGAVFMRLSVARAEDAENKRIASDMRQQLLHFAMKPSQNGSQPPNAEGIQAIESLITRMNNMQNLGRVPVVADPATLKGHPDLDMPLEPGDSVVIPKRPSTLIVMGEVLRPGALRYSKSGSVDDYLEQAGGPTQQADTSRVIVILPNGSVRANDSSWLSFGFGPDIPAGSTIFVPRELEYNTMRQLLVDSIQIFSQLATSAAALAVLSKQ